MKKWGLAMDISLVKNRIANFKIAIPDDATIVEKTVSGELQLYIKKATGAEAEIVEESRAQGTTIYVGHTEYSKKYSICGNSKENWIIKAIDGNIILTGGLSARDRGVAYSVYHFLEDYLGVHWWNAFEEYVPDICDFSVDGNIDDNKTPAVDFRKIIDLFSHKDFICQARNRMNIVGEDGVPDCAFNEEVKARGGAKYMGPPHHVHSIAKLFPSNELFAKHPEWWAFNERLNKRIDFGHMCLSNEEFYQAALEKLLGLIKEENRKCDEAGTERPYFYSVTFEDYVDREFTCECPECKKIINKAGKVGYILKFVNRLARDIGKIYSDVMLETLAYSVYVETPLDGTAPEHNVIIRYADIRQDMMHDLDHPNNADALKRLKAWVELCKTNNSPLFMWDYLLHYSPSCPMPQVYRVINNVKKTYDMGISGYFVENEAANSRDFWALDQWVLNRIIEDPTLDGDKLIDTFMNGYYGDAAKIVKEYLELAQKVADETGFHMIIDEPLTNWSYATVDFVEKAMEMRAEALSIVEGNETAEFRVKMAFSGVLKVIAVRYFEYKKTKEDMGEEFNFERKEIIDELILELKERIEKRAYLPDGTLQHPGLKRTGENCEIKYFTELIDKKPETYPLPVELKDIKPENVMDVLAKNAYSWRHGLSGASVVEDKESLVNEVLKLSKSEMAPICSACYDITEKTANAAQPLSFFIKNKNNSLDVFAYKMDIYKENLVSDKYHLYKMEGVTGITPKSNLILYLVHQRDLMINISAISKIMPFEECDIYISMKASGECYGGNKEDEEALYFERIIVVKTK